jgi:hypothetical protein
MNADGTAVIGSSVLLSGSSFGTPLDVTCPGPGAAPALSGTIFVGHHSSKITVLEPTDFESASGVRSGIFSFALDEDGDGYSNADEISNSSDPCSPAVTPPDWDGDFLSDLLDADDDNDGLSNQQEYAFGLLPDSGASVNPIAVPLDKATGTFSYTRRAAALTPLNYSVWFSTDLSVWTEDTGATEGTPVLNGEVETVPVTLSALPGNPLPDKLFVQVRAH